MKTSKHIAPRSMLSDLRLIVVCVLIFTAKCALGEELDEPAARDAIAQRLKSIQSIIVKYDVEAIHTPENGLDARAATQLAVAATQPVQIGKGGIRLSLTTGTKHSSHRFAFVEGNARWDELSSEERIKEDIARNVIPITSDIRAYFPGIGVEVLNIRADGPLGMIADEAWLQRGGFSVALGLGLSDTDFPKTQTAQWMTHEALAAMKILRDDSGHVLLQNHNHVDQLVEYVFDPEQKYALIAFRRHNAKPPFAMMTEVVSSQFNEIDGVPLPSLIVGRGLTPAAKPLIEWRATIKEYRVNDPANTVSSLQIAWPRGTTVADLHTGKRIDIKITRDGQTLLDNELRRK